METYTKLDENRITIKPEVITPDEVVKEYSELEKDLAQAQESLVYVQSRHAEEIKPIQATVDLFQKRVDEATKKGVVAKPVEVIEEPILETPAEELIIK